MFTTSLFVNKLPAWIKSQLSALSGKSNQSLKSLLANEPYLIFRSRRSFISSPCFGLVFVKSANEASGKVNLYCLPNPFVFISLFLLILSAYFSWKSYSLAMQAHSIEASYRVAPFPWGYYLPALLLLLILTLGAIRIEKPEITKELQKYLHPNE